MSQVGWQELEHDTAELLGGKRIVRDWSAFESAPDVEVPDFSLVCDCKAYQRFSHHTLLETCKRKYCGPTEVPALVTRRPGGRAAITLPLDFFAGLLNEIRAARSVRSGAENSAAVMGRNHMPGIVGGRRRLTERDGCDTLVP
jgi:hypothetical protein